MTRRLLRSVAAALVGSTLFAQMAVAAYVCPESAGHGLVSPQAGSPDLPSSSPAQSSAKPQGVMPMPGCDEMASGGATASSAAASGAVTSGAVGSGPMDPSAPNLCAEHCQQDQQGDLKPAASVPPIVRVALYVVSPSEPSEAPRRDGATTSALVAAAPPLGVLHCVYRI